MKGPSEQAKILLDELSLKPGFLSRITDRAPDRSLLLRQLADLDDPEVIPYIFGLILDPSSAVEAEAAKAVFALMRNLKSKQLLALDCAIRQRAGELWAGESAFGFFQIKPSSLKKMMSYGDVSAMLLGVASFSANGYVRQEAVNLLSEINSGKELPFLLIRLNDWVTHVKIAAEVAVEARLKPEYAGHFIDYLQLVIRLQFSNRYEIYGLIGKIKDLLKDENCREQLIAGLSNSIPQVRRYCYELLFSIETIDLLEWGRRAARDPDPMVRLNAVRKIKKQIPDEKLRHAIEPFEKDHNMKVRREILDIIVNRFGPAACKAEIRSDLFATHPGMREFARYCMSKLDEPIDFAELYRSRLREITDQDLIGAMLGLAETGVANDDKLILPYLSHRRIRVKRTAIRALARLNAERHISVFRECMLNGSPGESKESLKALMPNAVAYGLKQLWTDFPTVRDMRVRNHLITLINKLGKWDRLLSLLWIVTVADKAEIERAIDLIFRWLRGYNLSFSEPTKEQVNEISTLLSRLEQPLGEPLVQSLKFAIQPFNS